MPEPEAEVQATASLSPVSPSPVHATSPLVVPTLQNTVDTIDAMVSAVATAVSQANQGHVQPPVASIDGDGDTIIDDDSLNDPYGDDEPVEPSAELPEKHFTEPEDNDDDYAKTFDSPVPLADAEEEDENGVGAGAEQVPSVSHASSDKTPSSDPLPTPSPTACIPFHDPSLSQKDAADKCRPLQAHDQHDKKDVPNMEFPQCDGKDVQATSKLASDKPQNDADATCAVLQSPSQIDLERLVTDITAQYAQPNSNPDSPAVKAEQPVNNSSLPTPSSTLPSSSTLPPRPPQPIVASHQSYTSMHPPAGLKSSISANNTAQSHNGQSTTYVAAGAPGTSTNTFSKLRSPPGIGSLESSPLSTNIVPRHLAGLRDEQSQRKWEQFLTEERQYMAEARWDRFPEGSRIFIGTRSAAGASKNGAHIFCTGNLSSDKVSKRDVFDLFSPFGRLAQISLKSAYGFVQYHTVDEGKRAIDHMQGAEMKGRRIHLEVSKIQDKSKRERAPRSPDRSYGQTDRRQSRNENYGNQSHGQNYSDYRSAHNHSPHSNGYGRDQGLHQGSGRGGRGRSRSPSYGINRDYRQRSPSPRGRREPELDLPRRYGADVPDVQIIMQPDVNRDFAAWVEGAIKSKGLTAKVMILHPRMPKDQVIQRQAMEGVHAVIDLDMRSQHMCKIPVQAFDRSGGSSNVRFDQYVDLDVNVAGEVIMRTKGSNSQATTPSLYGQPYGYSSSSFAGSAQPAATYGQQQQQNMGYGPIQQQLQQPQQPTHANTADLVGLLSSLDKNTLQQLLSPLQGVSQGGLQGGVPPAVATQGLGTGVGQQVDIQSLLSKLGNGSTSSQAQQTQQPHSAHVQPQPPQPYQQHQSTTTQYGNGFYGLQPSSTSNTPGLGTGSGPGPAAMNGDSAAQAQVQNIMAQLARYRQ